ncbi:hypothetical protein J6590_006995 [Homalodisca vitripennis]|nr:hypothetical protein J6590_006995 [Homalodisca vitripennis]
MKSSNIYSLPVSHWPLVEPSRVSEGLMVSDDRQGHLVRQAGSCIRRGKAGTLWSLWTPAAQRDRASRTTKLIIAHKKPKPLRKAGRNADNKIGYFSRVSHLRGNASNGGRAPDSEFLLTCSVCVAASRYRGVESRPCTFPQSAAPGSPSLSLNTM